jgi:divalent metal cation (Fe/Co/Zn/Cd) transporter
MGDNKEFVKDADKLAGITTIVLIALGVIQIILGETISKSVALTANGIDCMGDAFVSAVVWIGLRYFKKPADQKYHYGYYKIENLASIGAAIVMIGLAAYIVFRSYLQLVDPHPVNLPILGAFVAFIAAVVAIGLGAYKYRKGKKSKMGSVKLDAFNTIKDGFIIADAIVGFIIAGVIVSIGFAAIKESSNMLLDACNTECIDRSFVIKQIVEDLPEVEKAHVVRLRRSGPIHQGELEIKVSCDMTVREFNSVKRKIIKNVQSQLPDVEKLTITAIEEDED